MRSTSFGASNKKRGQIILLVVIFLMVYCAYISARNSDQNRRSLYRQKMDPKSVVMKQSQTSKISTKELDELYRNFGKLMLKSSLDMITTQCHEPLERVFEVADLLHVRHLYVYSKCGQTQPAKSHFHTVLHYYRLPNVGREGHSWVTHILRKDIRFAEWNLFVQGSVETPLENILEARIALEQNQTVKGKKYDFLDLYQTRPRLAHCLKHVYEPCMDRPKDEVCAFHDKYRFNKDQTCETAPVTLRGEFLVSGDLLKRQTQHQTELMQLERELASSIHPQVGHFLERMWVSILGATHLDLISQHQRGDAATDFDNTAAVAVADHQEIEYALKKVSLKNLEMMKPIPEEPLRPDEWCPNHHLMASFEFTTDGKVNWVSESKMKALKNRGRSMHCLLAKIAPRVGNKPFRVRIFLGDKDIDSPFVLVPAKNEGTEYGKTKSLLFPDFTFNSWPEVGDYSSVESYRRVASKAKEYGLPGTAEWQKRDARLAWRGATLSELRKEIVEMSSNERNGEILDVQAIIHGKEPDGGQKIRGNSLSREDHCKYRMLLHLNGFNDNQHSSALKWKLLCGSLVFVSTPIFVEWWSAEILKPFVHYVPFSNATDLMNKVIYFIEHLEEAETIARNGMNLAAAAFESLEDFVADTLSNYALAITDKLFQEHVPKCAFHEESGLDNGSRAKSYQELQKEYGPMICV